MQFRKFVVGSLIASTIFACNLIEAQAAPNTDSFDVTVPVSLPVSITADGTITTATDLKISNNCTNGRAVGVSQIDASAADDWTLVAYGASAIDAGTVDQKKIALSLTVSGEEGHTTKQGSAETIVSHTAGSFGAMTADVGKSMPITYDVEIGPQTEALADVAVMSVVFTIDYVPLDSGPIPYDPENTGSSIYSDHWITSENRGDSLIVTVPTLANSDGSNMSSVDPSEHVFQFLLEDKTSGDSPEVLDGVLNITTPYETGKYYSSYTGAKFTVSVKSDDEINAWAMSNAGNAARLKELAAMFRAVMDNQGTDAAAGAGIDLDGDGSADHKLRLYIALEDGTEYADFEIPRYYVLQGIVQTYNPRHPTYISLYALNDGGDGRNIDDYQTTATFSTEIEPTHYAGLFAQDFSIKSSNLMGADKQGQTYWFCVKKAGHVTLNWIDFTLSPATLDEQSSGCTSFSLCKGGYGSNTDVDGEGGIALIWGDFNDNGSSGDDDLEIMIGLMCGEIPWTGTALSPNDEMWEYSIYNPSSAAYAADGDGSYRVTGIDLRILNKQRNFHKNAGYYSYLEWTPQLISGVNGVIYNQHYKSPTLNIVDFKSAPYGISE